MQMFWRFCVFVFLCVTLLYAGGIVDVHAQNLSVRGIGRVYQVNDTVSVEFIAEDGRGNPVKDVTLTITHSGLTDVVMSNGGTTDVLGEVTVTGKIIADTDVYIQAEWPDRRLSTRFEPPIIRDVAQEPFLEIVDSTDSVTVGATLKVVFRAGYNGAGEPGIPLRITASPNINITSPTPVSGTHTTGRDGFLTVTGILQRANVPTHIRAFWEESRTRGLAARADIPAVEGIALVLIVMNSPDPKSPLKIGDTFTQRITIENRDSTHPTLPLSAWQMDVVYNPLTLKVVSVTESDFLSSDGKPTYYTEDTNSPGKIRVSQARSSPPPLPGIFLRPGDKGTLLTIVFEVLEIAEEPLGIHNVRLQSSPNEDGTLDRLSYSIMVTDVLSFKSPELMVDVNQDGTVNILDLVAVAASIGMVLHNPRADVNGDGFVNVLDLIAIYTSEHWAGSVDAVKVSDANEPAPKAPSANRNVNPATIQTWIDLARIEGNGSAVFDLGIANLEALLASRIPTETRLLLNYPNPFNPETWIPYQLAEATEVTVTIHAINSSLIRKLELGHQPAGTYKRKSQAAYWDGRNAFGERVASGLYFYTLTAGDFTATRKMLIRK